MGFPRRSQQEMESVEGKMELYHCMRLDYATTNIGISEEEYALLEVFVKDNIDVIREGEKKGFVLFLATYIIGSGDRIGIEDLQRELDYGSRAGKSGEYWIKHARQWMEDGFDITTNPYGLSSDFSEEEYLALLYKEPYYLEGLRSLQTGYDYLKARIS